MFPEDNNDDLSLDFDPQTHVVTPSKFDPIPGGTYRFAVGKIASKMIAEKTTLQFTVELTVSEGEHKGRKVWGRHSHKTTRTDDGMQESVRIGNDRLAEIMQACHAKGRSLSECIGCELDVKIKVRPARNGYDASNEVVCYVVPKGAPAAERAAGDAPKPSSKPGFMNRKG
jgi:hypothetical protein